MSNRLSVLKNSLAKKEALFEQKLEIHFDTVKQANGQPLNDKRNGAATLRKWDRQNDALHNLKESIQKTKDAIEWEEGTIRVVADANEVTPPQILSLVESGILQQWRKHPNTFFVTGVEKARIVWDNKKKVVAYKYLSAITDKDQRAKFAEIYNSLFQELNK
jgi:hypothetical protein